MGYMSSPVPGLLNARRMPRPAPGQVLTTQGLSSTSLRLALSHPEIDRRENTLLELSQQNNSSEKSTLVDVLEIQASSGSSDHHKSLSQESMVELLEDKSKGVPDLRILFISDAKTIQAHLDTSTTEFLVKNIGVSPSFLTSVTGTNWYKPLGNTMFNAWSSEKQDDGSLVSLCGFYRFHKSRYHDEWHEYGHTWYNYDFVNHRSTYIIHNCSPVVHQAILRLWADDGARKDLLRPLAIDCMLVDDLVLSWMDRLAQHGNDLLRYEELTREEHATIDPNFSVFELHSLLQQLNFAEDRLQDATDRIDYLLKVHASIRHGELSHDNALSVGVNTPATVTSVQDSLTAIHSRTAIHQRWLRSYQVRVNIQINLFFNLSQQRDNKTNLRIADLTAKDSSAMITIAALTLIFLPGTFVATIFSMVFFNTSSTDSESPSSLTVAKGWWLYPAITVPFTVMVVLAWNSWRVRRNKEQDTESYTSELGTKKLV